ncbi:MAG: serine/threonine protein kinase [Myxococcales bacterium]|nr:serine/threonine protein kinase [Myxococcales bacterium]
MSGPGDVRRSRLAPGRTLEGRFFLLEEIGHGGMSTVFKARDLRNGGETVAVKVPLPQYSSGLGSWSMTQREAEIGATLRHPSIVRFIPLAPNKSRLVVTEYLVGTPLAPRIGNGRHLSEDEALDLASRLCEAVDYLHGQGIVHYDLKPGNVMLCEDGSIRVIDFGAAHWVLKGRFQLGGPGPAVATANYAAPEQVRRRRGQPSVDIYAIGAILYEMLTGHCPYEGDDPFVVASTRQIGDPRAPRSLNPALSLQAEEIVLRALRRDPAERYATAAQFKRDLDEPSQVRVTGLAGNLVEVTAWRKGLRWARYVALVGVAPIAFLMISFRLLWWYFDRAR